MISIISPNLSSKFDIDIFYLCLISTSLQLTERLRPPDLQLDLVLHELAQPRHVLLVHQPRVRRDELPSKISFQICRS